jgi:DNA mismatch repair ATPase MutS
VNAARLARFPEEVVKEAQARVDELQTLAHKHLPQAEVGEEGRGEKRGRTQEEEAEAAVNVERKRQKVLMEDKKAAREENRKKRALLMAFSDLPLEDLPVDEAIEAFTAAVQSSQ